MKSKQIMVKILILIIALMLVGCDIGLTTTGPLIYDSSGTWDFQFDGVDAVVVVTGNSWILNVPGMFTDHGIFNRNRNAATLYSNNLNTNVGSAVLTSNITMILNLVDPSDIQGTYYGFKRIE